MNHWSEIAEQLRQQVESRHQAREQGLQACRKATQLCARAIRSLHRHEFDACRELLTQAYREISHAREQLRPFPQIYYAGFLQDAEKELVEGETLYSIVLGDALPEPDELGVDVGAYLNGVAEAEIGRASCNHDQPCHQIVNRRRPADSSDRCWLAVGSTCEVCCYPGTGDCEERGGVG